MTTHRFLLKLFLAIILLQCVSLACYAADKRSQAAEIPDVLVLVLSGIGSFDKVSINYASDVSDKDVDSDLKNLAQATRWQMRDAKQTTQTAAVPGAKPITSVSFDTPRVVSTTDGILPVEPFVDVFKRFKTIRINYLITMQFSFAGLKNFENDFVNVVLKQSGNSYEYTVSMKNNDFERAGLPDGTNASVETSGDQAGMSGAKRVIIIVGLALLGAVFAYFVAAYICKRRKTGE
ncbi:MAG: hypothetical protein ABFD49_11230 [Armatimonadota bacterium]|nr:hypothetical protein [bacterium]